MRSFLDALFAAAVLLHVSLIQAQAADQQQRPNIVLIMVDDMGYGDLHSYNPDSKIPTPHIDELATEGMRFTDAHSAASVCVPTRYGLMTGRYPFRHQLRERAEAVIEPDRYTLPQMLSDAGYETAMVGKWHLGFRDGAGYQVAQELHGGPVDVGFDSWFGMHASLDIEPFYYIRDKHPVLLPTERIEASDSVDQGWTKIQGAFWRAGRIAPNFVHEEVTPWFTAEAVNVITQHERLGFKKPLFLYVAFPSPHTPWLPSEQFRGKSGAGMYGDFVMQVDAHIGQILGALKHHHMQENTLVIFTSDNGPVWYPNDIERFGHDAVGGLRGMKGDAWEGGHRMPLLVRWPGVVAPGTVIDHLVCQTDFFRTLASLVGADLPDTAAPDSINIFPYLKGELAKTPLRKTFVTRSSRSHYSVRDGNWKLITALGSGGFSKPSKVNPGPNDPAGQLYDLSRDIGEQHNLYATHPEKVAQLQAILKTEQSRTQSP